MTISDGQLAILVGLLLQTLFLSSRIGRFQGRVERTLEEHDRRLTRLEPAPAKARS